MTSLLSDWRMSAARFSSLPAIGEPTPAVLPVGCGADLGQEVGGDNSILMFAQQGLQILGIPRDALHSAVGWFDEFSCVAQPLRGLTRPEQPIDIAPRVSELLVGLSLRRFHTWSQSYPCRPRHR